MRSAIAAMRRGFTMQRAALAVALSVSGGLTAASVVNALRVRRDEARATALAATRRALLSGDVPATDATARRVKVAAEEWALCASAWEARLVGPSPSTLRPGLEESVTERTDAFFDLAWFAEEMRATAAAANVELLPREAFGFAEHAEGAPRNEDVGRVERQRERIESLLRQLFKSGPTRLDYVRRERSAIDPSRSRAHWPQSGADSDYFEPADDLLLRRRWNVDTMAFKVGFVAKGAGPLRALLNHLLEDATGWIVRWVEVNPVEAVALTRNGLAAAPPLRFELLVESLEGPVDGRHREERS